VLENKVQTDISQAIDKKSEKISSDIPEILEIDEIFVTLLAYIENYIKFCTKNYLTFNALRSPTVERPELNNVTRWIYIT
jgi:hypothetical protein